MKLQTYTKWGLIYLVVGAASFANVVLADELARDVNKTFSKIGIGPEQIDRYTQLYDDFLRARNQAVRRVLNSNSGESVPVLVRKRVGRVAKKSVKQMSDVLTEQQLKYYEQYLELANKLFLRESGLR